MLAALLPPLAAEASGAAVTDRVEGKKKLGSELWKANASLKKEKKVKNIWATREPMTSYSKHAGGQETCCSSLV